MKKSLLLLTFLLIFALVSCTPKVNDEEVVDEKENQVEEDDEVTLEDIFGEGPIELPMIPIPNDTYDDTDDAETTDNTTTSESDASVSNSGFPLDENELPIMN